MTAAAGEKRRSNWIPWAFVGGFVIIIIASLILALFALDTFTGLETEQPYRKGIAYNDVIAAREAQAARGWRVESAYASAGGDAGLFTVTFQDKDGTALDGLTVVAEFGRAVDARYDREIVLQAAGGGSYEAVVELPFKGDWQADIRATGIGDPYRLRERFWVR
jgi:nitrogen fixation protein FixH